MLTVITLIAAVVIIVVGYQSGHIKSLVVEPVREKDKFTHEPTNPKKPITHKVDHSKDRGNVYAVYALAKLMSGGLVHEVMNLADVNAIRDRSDALPCGSAQAGYR